MIGGINKVSRIRSREMFCGLVTICVLSALIFTTQACGQGTGSSSAASPKTPPILGTIKSISGNLITLAPDNGPEVKISVPVEAKVLSVPPGSKDLKEATAIHFADLQPGDRVLVRAKLADDTGSMVASSVIAMKKADISEKQAHEREDWQRRGIGGLVKSVDTGASTITIGTTTATGPKDVAIHLVPATVVRRYAPGSVKFDDAKLSSIGEIHVGDQVRARGTKSPDGLDFSADEVVSGAFRNLAGTIAGIDANAGTMTVSDLATKKNVEVKITSDSQLRKIPAPVAQRIAMRLKGAPAGASGSGSAPPSAATTTGAGPGALAGGQGAGGASGGGMGGGQGNRAGGGDMQQMLSRLPASTLNDFQKGDAVMIVATGDAQDAQVVAITLLGGVEPILQGSNQSQAASILTPWSLNSGGGADAGTP
jgi:hypothetical protein